MGSCLHEPKPKIKGGGQECPPYTVRRSSVGSRSLAIPRPLDDYPNRGECFVASHPPHRTPKGGAPTFYVEADFVVCGFLAAPARTLASTLPRRSGTRCLGPREFWVRFKQVPGFAVAWPRPPLCRTRKTYRRPSIAFPPTCARSFAAFRPLRMTSGEFRAPLPDLRAVPAQSVTKVIWQSLRWASKMVGLNWTGTQDRCSLIDPPGERFHDRAQD